MLTAKALQKPSHRCVPLLPALPKAAAESGAVKVERKDDLIDLLAPLAQLMGQNVYCVWQVGGSDIDLQCHRAHLWHDADHSTLSLNGPKWEWIACVVDLRAGPEGGNRQALRRRVQRNASRGIAGPRKRLIDPPLWQMLPRHQAAGAGSNCR